MFGRKKGDGINASVELDYVEQKHITGDYGHSNLDSERRPTVPGMRALLIAVFIAVIAIPLVLSWKAWNIRKNTPEHEEKQQEVVEQIIPSYTPRIIKEETESVEEAVHPEENLSQTWSQLIQTTIPSQLIKDTEELARRRMLNSSLNTSSDSGSSGSSYQSNDTATTENNHELFNQLQPVQLNKSRAHQLKNRDLIITQGTQLDCILETKIITTQPGMTTCHLTRDVYSTSGRVVLLDRGSKVVGFYQSGIQQGQSRVFVQWLRVETPSGVVINLNSPGTGALGEAGIGGWIDRHFWERFGGAILISVITDVGGWLKNKANAKASDEKKSPPLPDTQNAESVVTELLHNSMNIEPTLYKNQGERVNIFVARDLDFSDVYTLTTN
ncbi:type IV secretion system protein VirB10 [Bartonella sp. F02]|uniref:type IV secretion system protein VirB10 n=1 Tax=Bartonella sp. F02 TaxID=2967262 RepID=UPI0022A8FD97|nr:type IV secretion system protein VirB10 [Bartonella sp. F02]MCZ2327843.1 type IV secretion system protein VirB10 [Bartonella sp. F02]